MENTICKLDLEKYILKVDDSHCFRVINVEGDGNCFYRALLCDSSIRSIFSDYMQFRQQLSSCILWYLRHDPPSVITMFLHHVFDAVVSSTSSTPDLESYVKKNILVEGQWGEVFEALTIMLLFPSLKVNIHVIACGIHETTAVGRFVEVMNMGQILQGLYLEKFSNSDFIDFLSYNINTCNQVCLLLGNYSCPFIHVTETIPHNHYYFLRKIEIAFCSLFKVVETPWLVASREGNSTINVSLEDESQEKSEKRKWRNAASKESQEERKKRQLRHAVLTAVRRQNESQEQRENRKLKYASSTAAKRQSQSQEEQGKRKLRNAASTAARRQKESQEDRERRNLKNACSTAAKRQKESQEEQKERKLRDAASTAARRQKESQEDRERRNLKNACSTAATSLLPVPLVADSIHTRTFFVNFHGSGTQEDPICLDNDE
jgi:hypothetical protein